MCVWRVSPGLSGVSLRAPPHCRIAAPSYACAAARPGVRAAPGPAGSAEESELTEEPAEEEEDQTNDAHVSPGPIHTQDVIQQGHVTIRHTNMHKL